MFVAAWKPVLNFSPYASCFSIAFLLLTILLFSGCEDRGPEKQSSEPVKNFKWEGTPQDFRNSFSMSTGRFVFAQDNQTFSGIAFLSGTPSYTLEIQEGLPVRFARIDTGTPIDRWQQDACWIGVDAAWEEDFQETEKGLFYAPGNELFTGKVFSIDSKTGQILVEYTYQTGISHGPEIYYDEQGREESRINWVNGMIPFQKL